MTPRHENKRERLHELLALRAVEGLGPVEARELQALADELGVDPAVSDYDLAAAAVELAALTELDEPPMRLRLLLQRDAKRHFETARGSAERESVPAAPRRPRRSDAPRRTRSVPGAEPRPRRVGPAWLVAAAALLLAAFLLWQDAAPVPVPSPAERRAELLRDAPDAVLFDWNGTEDPAAIGAGGDVVWSNERQQGYMRISGLQANEPTEEQYQLWIFDARRPPETPVDGGVFDVPAGSGEVVVPIDAKIEVFEPGLFAVTVERPGGVVVSERGRIVLAGSLE